MNPKVQHHRLACDKIVEQHCHPDLLFERDLSKVRHHTTLKIGEEEEEEVEVAMVMVEVDLQKHPIDDKYEGHDERTERPIHMTAAI